MILFPFVGLNSYSVSAGELGTNTYTTPGSTTETIPVGATGLIVRVWGAGGGGGRFNVNNGGGGGGGGGVKKTVVIQATDWGQTINYTVGAKGIGHNSNTDGTAGAASTVTSSGLSFTNLNLNAGGGAGGLIDGSGGAGGSASGGDTNNPGVAGETDVGIPTDGGNSATLDGITGSGGLNGNNGSNPGGGGGGDISPSASGDGADGRVDFVWS